MPDQRTIAGEGELAPGCAFRPLEHHAADRLGKGGMARAVDHDLRHGALAQRIVARFVEHAGGQAVDRPGALLVGADELEGARRRIGAGREGDGGVEGAGIVGIEILERDGLDRRQFGLGHDALRQALDRMVRQDRRRGADDRHRRCDRRNRDQQQQEVQAETGIARRGGRLGHGRRGFSDEGSGAEGRSRAAPGSGEEGPLPQNASDAKSFAGVS